MASSSDSALLDAAQALGVVDELGSPNGDFFSSPLATIGGVFRSRYRRERLVAAIDRLLIDGDPVAALDGADTTRYYSLLPADLEGQLYFVAQLAAAGEVTFLLAAEMAVTDDFAIALDVPLLRGSGEGQDPVFIAGSATGAVRVRAVQQLNPGQVALEAMAWVEGSEPRGTMGVRIEGVVVNGEELPPIAFTTDDLADGAVDAILQVLRFVLAAVPDTAGSVVKALADHLPGLLGLDEDINVRLPIDELFTDPNTLLRWLAALANAPEGLRAWFGHVAGLLGAESATTNSSPTAAAPWQATLTAPSTTPEVALTTWLDRAADGTQWLIIGLRVTFREPAPGRIALGADVELVQLPLGGDPAAAEFLSAGAVLVRAPAEGGDLVATDDVRVGSLAGGVRWNANGLRPVLEAGDVKLPGSDKVIPHLDLTDGDVLASTMEDQAKEFLASKLGAPGAFRTALLTLIGLDGATSVDFALLATAPTRASPTTTGAAWKTEPGRTGTCGPSGPCSALIPRAL